MCERTASALGLTVERARGSEFGSYRVPGSDDSRAYVGVVRGPVSVRFGADVTFELTNVRVLTHPAPLLLLGSDLLRGGDMSGNDWNFGGMQQRTVGAGHVEGTMVFSRGAQVAECPLLFCPARAGRRFSTGGVGGPGGVNTVIHLDDGVAPIGGQYVRLDS
jgi:hypothetical protein